MALNSKKISDIRVMQTELLFKGLSTSVAGSLLVALAIVFIISHHTGQKTIWIWLLLMTIISILRWINHYLYSRVSQSSKTSQKWYKQFKLGVYSAAVLWGSLIWLFFPVNHPEYQVLLVLALSGVSGAALAVLSYDSKMIIYFQGIIFLFVESRLLWDNTPFSFELAILNVLFFSFIMKSGYEIGKNYVELITHRYDSEKNKSTLLSITEEIAQIGYWQWDMQSPYIRLSANLAKMCHVDSEHINMSRCLDMVHTDDKKRVRMAIESVVATGADTTVEYRLRVSDNDGWLIMNQIIKRIQDSQDEYSLVGTVQDISVIKTAEQKIFDMAYYDELTGLANRSLMKINLSDQIKHARRNKNKLAVLFIDLDGFKEINDTLGHDRGDDYLKIIADRLKNLLREDDFISRFGGDEFCIILGDLNDGIDASRTAEKCLSLSMDSVVLETQKINPKMSIGIAVYPDDGEEVSTLLKTADTAMYSAKHKGKHNYAFYSSKMTLEAITRQKLEAELIQALDNNEFELWYQPKISLTHFRLTGVEALIRWRHPEQGLVMPDQFIETAERIGLINKIGEWVLVSACTQLQQWQQQNINLNMAINISSGHFSSEGFSENVEYQMNHYGLSAGDLEIEITESQTRNPEEHISICERLKSKGILVAIDDFGTGYSSLSVLKKLQIDTLKVDREFIRDLPHEPSAVLMVSTIVNMSLSLGYNIVAEGVETLEQAEFLKKLGCPVAQGYFFSKPVQAEYIPKLMKKNFFP